MSVFVFYHSDPINNPFLSEEESFHAGKVLRLKIGSAIELLDGRGNRYQAIIEQIDGKKTSFQHLISVGQLKPKKFKIHLYVAPTKQMERMEWMVEKCTEFGIDSIHFFHSRYSERKEIKLQRLEKTAISALKQSKNLYLPLMHAMISFKDLLDIKIKNTAINQQWLFGHIAEDAIASLSKSIELEQEYHILIGPEGDFSKEESIQLLTNSWVPFSLGQAILRTETAGIAITHAINLFHESKS